MELNDKQKEWIKEAIKRERKLIGAFTNNDKNDFHNPIWYMLSSMEYGYNFNKLIEFLESINFYNPQENK